MSSVRIKICGITTPADASACADAGADYLGFVFHPPSPRYLTPREAGRIIASLPGTVTPVGVFVDETPAGLDAAIRESGVRMVQLCGDETPDYCRRVSLPAIKVFRVPPGSVGRPGPREYPVFALMADGAAPGMHGGSGSSADLSLARDLSAISRLFLAGGLHSGNVGACVSDLRPFAVDVSSGVELSPGIKDHDKVRSFCSVVRSLSST